MNPKLTVSGIDRVGRVIEERVRLIDRSGVVHTREQARAVAAVVAEAVDIKCVAARRGIDLEGDGLSSVGADLVTKPSICESP